MASDSSDNESDNSVEGYNSSNDEVSASDSKNESALSDLEDNTAEDNTAPPIQSVNEDVVCNMKFFFCYYFFLY